MENSASTFFTAPISDLEVQDNVIDLSRVQLTRPQTLEGRNSLNPLKHQQFVRGGQNHVLLTIQPSQLEEVHRIFGNVWTNNVPLQIYMQQFDSRKILTRNFEAYISGFLKILKSSQQFQRDVRQGRQKMLSTLERAVEFHKNQKQRQIMQQTRRDIRQKQIAQKRLENIRFEQAREKIERQMRDRRNQMIVQDQHWFTQLLKDIDYEKNFFPIQEFSRQQLVGNQRMIYQQLLQLRQQITTFLRSPQTTRLALWIQLLNIRFRFSPQVFQPFPFESQEKLRELMVMKLQPLDSQQKLSGFVKSYYPQAQIYQVRASPQQVVQSPPFFENFFMKYLRHTNEQLYKWVQETSPHHIDQAARSAVSKIYFDNKGTQYVFNQDSLFYESDQKYSLSPLVIKRYLDWAEQFKQSLVAFIVKLLEIMQKYQQQGPQFIGSQDSMIIQFLIQNALKFSSYPDQVTLILSGQRYWSTSQNSDAITPINNVNFNVHINPQMLKSPDVVQYVRSQVMKTIDRQTDQYYVHLVPHILFRQVRIRSQIRQAMATFFSAQRNFDNKTVKKVYELIQQTIHKKNTVPNQLIPAIHGWSKQQGVKIQSNCVMKSMEQLSDHYGHQLTNVQRGLISKGWALKVCVQHKWPFYLASKPSYKPCAPIKNGIALYVMPYHTHTISCALLATLQAEKKPSKYVFGRKRMGDKMSLMDNSICFDVQAYAINQEVQQIYLLTWWGKIDGIQSQGMIKTSQQKMLTGYEIMASFIQWLLFKCSLPQRQGASLVVYSYNGPKYEFKYLIRPLLARVAQVKSFGSASASKGLTCLNGALHFRDPKFLFAGGSLKKNSDCFNPPHFRKIPLHLLDPPINLPKSFFEYLENQQIIDQYCMNDSKAGMYLVYSFFQTLQSVLKQVSPQSQVKIQEFYGDWTAPQVAMHVLETIFCKDYRIKPQQDQAHLIPQRLSNFGGMVGGNFSHFQGDVISCDFNSAYPSAMTQKLPFSRISQWIKPHKDELRLISQGQQAQMLSLYQCFDISFAQHQHQFIPYRSKESLTYLTQIKSMQYCWGITLKTLLNHGGSLTIRNVTRYSSKDQGIVSSQRVKGRAAEQVQGFKNFVNSFYALRKKHQKLAKLVDQKKQPIHPKSVVMHGLIKTMTNSSYGKLNQQNFDNKTLLAVQQVEQIKLSFESIKKEQGYMTGTNPSTQLTNSGNLVRLSSYITSIVRARLTQGIQLVGKKNVVYYDTDSIYFKKGRLESLRPMISQDQLGKFSIQKYQFSQGIILAPKMRFFKTSHLWGKPFVSISSKTKGITFNDEEDQEKLMKLYQQMWEKMQRQPIGFQAGVRYEMVKVQGNFRWMWDKQRTGNVIQQFDKVMNFYQKKIRQTQNNYMKNLNWQQFMNLK